MSARREQGAERPAEHGRAFRSGGDVLESEAEQEAAGSLDDGGGPRPVPGSLGRRAAVGAVTGRRPPLPGGVAAADRLRRGGVGGGRPSAGTGAGGDAVGEGPADPRERRPDPFDRSGAPAGAAAAGRSDLVGAQPVLEEL